MTGGELINLLYEDFDNEGLVDAEMVLEIVLDALNRINVPKEHSEPSEFNNYRVRRESLEC